MGQWLAAAFVEHVLPAILVQKSEIIERNATCYECKTLLFFSVKLETYIKYPWKVGLPHSSQQDDGGEGAANEVAGVGCTTLLGDVDS